MRAPLAIAALLAVAGVAPGAPTPRPRTASSEPLRETPEGQLARAKQDYAKGDYERVLATVAPLVYPEVLLSPDDEVLAHKLLALSHFFRREVTKATLEFTTVLQIKDDFALDPLYEPPTAIDFLDNIRKNNREKLEELAAQKRKDEEIKRREEEIKRREEEAKKRRDATPTVIERTVRKNHLVINFVPFGAGQFQNGETRLGWILLTTEAVLGATSLATWAALQFKYIAPRLPVPVGERNLAVSLNITAVVTGAMFWGEVVFGIVEALVRWKPVTTSERKISGKPVALRPYIPTGGGGGMLLQGAF